MCIFIMMVLKMMMMRIKDDVEYRDVDNASRTSEFSALAPLCTTGIFDSIIESCFHMTEHFNQNGWLQNYINKLRFVQTLSAILPFLDKSRKTV